LGSATGLATALAALAALTLAAPALALAATALLLSLLLIGHSDLLSVVAGETAN
jgi:hypothetical protein